MNVLYRPVKMNNRTDLRLNLFQYIETLTLNVKYIYYVFIIDLVDVQGALTKFGYENALHFVFLLL